MKLADGGSVRLALFHASTHMPQSRMRT
jgi:hypothetical protein